MIEQHQKEFRLKRGANILDYISKFSATEKAFFGILVVILCVSALILTFRVTTLFMVEIPAYSGQLHEGEVGLPRTINPVIAVSDIDRDMSTLVYSGLLKYKNASFTPDLAQSWTLSPDGLTYDFILNQNIKFQDGTPLTTDDIAFTVQKIQDSALKSPHQADWANVTVKVVSTNEVQFILKQPYSGFLANTTIGILPKHIWGNVSDDQFIFSQYNIQPIGTGPYKFGSITRDSGGIPTSYSLLAWKGYYAQLPHIQTMSLSFFPSEEKALQAFNQGSIDSLPSIDPSIATELITNTAENYTILKSPLPRIFGVFFNQNQATVLADPIVRTALTLATDRSAIIKNVLYGYGDPVYGPIPPSLYEDIGLGTPPTNSASSTANILGAQNLLLKNGWTKNSANIYEKKSTKPKTASTTLSFDIYTADSPDLVATAKLLKSQWSAIGASVNVQIFDSSDLYQNVIRPRKYDVLLFGQQIGKDRDLYAFWHSSQRNAPGLNIALYTNPKVDALLSDIRSTATTSTLISDYTKVDQYIRQDMPAIFLYSPDFIYAVPKSLKGIHLDSISIPSDRLNSITDWYTETEKVWNIFTK